MESAKIYKIKICTARSNELLRLEAFKIGQVYTQYKENEWYL
ncbi:hypothetical protein [Kosakonia phage Kc304]|uniref:Uncharacterized protein n=2 Tax=Winklervirus chi14 TaxID=2560752 RepID=A0A1Z1LY05_9CAUD|nr:hypothetical protein FDI23_gp021 [Serratia phage CHI14]ARW57444.1 hypothetical protein [Serratia phage CHI14]ARW57719.1 hypothetical protein [Serratia phage CBH8]QYN80467.1 hypothetical protein [Kosakonia phage Kc304]